MLAFPDDRVAPHIDDQFMLGSDLLVAPILDDEMRTVARDVYLPAGRWFEFATDTTHPGATPGTTHAGTSHPEITHPGVCHRGPGFVRVEASISQMPVFVRDGARIPRVDVDASVRCAEDVIDRPWTLHDYGDTADATWVLDGFDGAPVTPSALVLHG